MKKNISFVKKKIKELEEKIKAFKTTQEFLDFVKAMSRFHNYSFHNQILILSQKPDATRVAGFRAWKKLGRYVKRGEKGIVILVPITCVQENDDGEEEQFIHFRSGHVFDISQTEGKPLPDISLAVEDKGDAFYCACLKLAKEYDIDVDIISDFRTYGVSSGGKIVLRDDDNRTTMATTLIHEVAHELLHQKKDEQESDRETQELEAETVAYIVCSHFGIEPPSHNLHHGRRIMGLWNL